MRLLLIFFMLSLFACTQTKDGHDEFGTGKEDTTALLPDTPTVKPTAEARQDTGVSNARFRNVKAEKLDADTYRITGQGQIFEASFNWVIEDGHNELKSGYATTDAGAPEWGNFDFTVDIVKARPNSTLHLIIYEASAKDGSRQHLLPLVLK